MLFVQCSLLHWYHCFWTILFIWSPSCRPISSQCLMSHPIAIPLRMCLADRQPDYPTIGTLQYEGSEKFQFYFVTEMAVNRTGNFLTMKICTGCDSSSVRIFFSTCMSTPAMLETIQVSLIFFLNLCGVFLSLIVSQNKHAFFFFLYSGIASKRIRPGNVPSIDKFPKLSTTSIYFPRVDESWSISGRPPRPFRFTRCRPKR